MPSKYFKKDKFYNNCPKPNLSRSNQRNVSDPSDDDENFDASDFDEKISMPMGTIQTKNSSIGEYKAFDKISMQSKINNHP